MTTGRLEKMVALVVGGGGRLAGWLGRLDLGLHPVDVGPLGVGAERRVAGR